MTHCYHCDCDSHVFDKYDCPSCGTPYDVSQKPTDPLDKKGPYLGGIIAFVVAAVCGTIFGIVLTLSLSYLFN